MNFLKKFNVLNGCAVPLRDALAENTGRTQCIENFSNSDSKSETNNGKRRKPATGVALPSRPKNWLTKEEKYTKELLEQEEKETKLSAILSGGGWKKVATQVRVNFDDLISSDQYKSNCGHKQPTHKRTNKRSNKRTNKRNVVRMKERKAIQTTIDMVFKGNHQNVKQSRTNDEWKSCDHEHDLGVKLATKVALEPRSYYGEKQMEVYKERIKMLLEDDELEEMKETKRQKREKQAMEALMDDKQLDSATREANSALLKEKREQMLLEQKQMLLEHMRKLYELYYECSAVNVDLLGFEWPKLGRMNANIEQEEKPPKDNVPSGRKPWLSSEVKKELIEQKEKEKEGEDAYRTRKGSSEGAYRTKATRARREICDQGSYDL